MRMYEKLQNNKEDMNTKDAQIRNLWLISD